MFSSSTIIKSSKRCGISRGFSTSSIILKSGCSMVQPVHHSIRIKKVNLSPKYPEVRLPKNDIRSAQFRPTAVAPDRVLDHYQNTLASDLLLNGFSHKGTSKTGLKKREWDGSSPFHINRTLRKPRSTNVETPNFHKRTWENIACLDKVDINCFVSRACTHPDVIINAMIQLQQITGVKPKWIFAKTAIPTWKIAKGMTVGVKVTLKGRPMTRFMSTLSELILPNIKDFKGFSNKSGDKLGNLQFGLTPRQVSFFPEIQQNSDIFTSTFGFHVNIQTTAQSDPEARVLLSGLGFPFYGKELFPSRG